MSHIPRIVRNRARAEQDAREAEAYYGRRRVCECTHFQDEHKEGDLVTLECEAAGCPCTGFRANKPAQTDGREAE